MRVSVIGKKIPHGRSDSSLHSMDSSLHILAQVASALQNQVAGGIRLELPKSVSVFKVVLAAL